VFRARAILLLFCLALIGTAITHQANSESRPGPSAAVPTTDSKIVLGRMYLKLGDLEKARSNCEAALPTQLSEAENCLAELVQAQSEAKLRDFEGKVDLGKREDAITAALAVPVLALTSEQKKRFDDTRKKLRDLTLTEAQAKLPGKKDEVAILAAGIKFLSPDREQVKKANDILVQAQPGFWVQLVDLLKGTWLAKSSCHSCDNSGRLAGPVSGESLLGVEGQVYNAKGRKYDPRRLAGGTKTRWTLVPLVDERRWAPRNW